MTLTREEKQRLRSLGIYVCCEFSTGECVVEQSGVTCRKSAEHLKRLANPSIGERIRNWLIGRVA
ncbi:hypothetical protein [Modicisalibacter coralii]|uniref:hypothetical protein n=1 Tax=Modicisalibacter coralii TaxID=2304602 RepID=UPI001396A2FE|nr:hypothetical protein [Halomonas coralii]